MDRDLALGAELGDPAQRSLADHVDRVRGERGGDRRPEAAEVLEAAQRRLPHPRGVAVAVEQRRPDRRPHAGIGDGPRGRLRLPVHVPEAGGAGAGHLGAGQPRPPVDVLGVELRLDRPDPLFQPGHQRQVAAAAAKQRHRRVGVAVDQGRDQEGAVGVDRLVAGRGRDLRPDRRDPPVLAAHADGLAVEHGAGHRQRHLTGRPRPAAAAPPPGRRAGGSRWRCGRPPCSATSSSPAPMPLARLSTTQSAA